MTPEADRIRAEYQRRERELPRDFYALHRESMLFAHHGRERVLREALEAAGRLPLTGSLLEVGCGAGEWFATFERFGQNPARLAGLDLDEGRLTQARGRAPQADLRVGDATQLPWPDASFDVVFQSTVLSSILDEGARMAVAQQMQRVLTPGGVIVSYDFAWNNPANRAVKRVTAGDLKRLFPGFVLRTRRATLAPPLARRLVPLSWAVSGVLESVGLLNTHLVALLTRP